MTSIASAKVVSFSLLELAEQSDVAFTGTVNQVLKDNRNVTVAWQ